MEKQLFYPGSVVHFISLVGFTQRILHVQMAEENICTLKCTIVYKRLRELTPVARESKEAGFTQPPLRQICTSFPQL